MKPIAKAGIVAAGYVAAFVVAGLVLKLYIAATDTPDRVSSGGMYAFGDGMLFLAVLAVAAVPATGAAFYWLRSNLTFWGWISVGALVIAATSVAALLVYVTQAAFAPPSPMQPLAAFAVLRILFTPMCAGLFLLAGLFAPNRTTRFRLLAATSIELIVFGCTALKRFLSTR